MKKMYELLLERLETKSDELKERQDQFDVMWHNEKHSGCFERNAINNLLIMQQLKSEISELEYLKLLIQSQVEK